MRNVVLVTVDSLRADALSGSNGEQLAPNIARIGREGIAFESAIAPGPRTPSSVPAFLTGEFYRMEKPEMKARRKAIQSHLVATETLPERFSEMGYETLGFSLNPWTAADTGFKAIFDDFHELNPDSDSDIEFSPALPSVKFVDEVLNRIGRDDFLNWKNRREWFSHWSSFKDDIFDRISAASKPYFVWIFLMDTHQPTIVPRSHRKESGLLRTLYAADYFTKNRGESLPDRIDEWIQRSYRDSVRSADDFVGQLSESIGEEDVIAVHSDHGEAWNEHGVNGHEYHLYEENIRVPLVVGHPTFSDNVAENFSLLDLPALLTELSVASEFRPKKWACDFVPTLVEGEEVARLRSSFGDYNPHYRSLRGERFKLIETRDGDLLFDLDDDPHEKQNVISEYPEIGDAFQLLLDCRSRKREEKRRIVERVDELDLQAY